MPREESLELQRLEDEGAEQAVSETVHEMAEAYAEYIRSVRESLGSNRQVNSKLRTDLVSDLQQRLGAL